MASFIDPRLVKVRAGARGSGWAVGARGVLTARHVVAPFLDSGLPDGTKVDRCLAVPDPAPAAPVFDCDVIWQDKVRDLALLRVRDDCLRQWQPATSPASAPVLAEPGTDAVSAQAVGYPNLALDGAAPAPELVPGSLQPARGAVGGRMPFDVGAAVPDDSLLWQGMSGAAVRDAHGRLLGVVVTVDSKYQQRRFYVAPLPDPAVDLEFGQALTMVGAAAILEASAAPANRELLALLDPAGRPYPVAGVPELEDFGTRRSRTDVDTRGDPYYAYIPREVDQVLREALDRRAGGTERRALLLVGDAMTGKSRTLAEALRRHPLLAGRPLLAPHRDADLGKVVRLAAACGGVVWLDDVNTYTTGLDAAIRALPDTPGVVLAATLRTDQLALLQDSPHLRAAWDVLSAARFVEQVVLAPEWTAAERALLAGTEPVISQALQRGRPLGEVLGAADELRKRLDLGSPEGKALVFSVIDWHRTGLPACIAESQARRLWPAHLPAATAADLADMAAEDSEQVFRAARTWACQKIAGTTALLRRTRLGLAAEDYLIGQRTTGNSAIPDPIWQEAADTALASQSEAYLMSVGYQAAISGVNAVAERAMTPIAGSDSAFAAVAANAIGFVRQQQGNVAGARAVYQAVIDSGHPDQGPKAADRLGDLLREQGDAEGAGRAYQIAIDSGHPEAGPAAACGLGDLLAELPDADGARDAYQRAIDSGHPDHAPTAALRLGGLLAGHGDVDGARNAYQRAIDSGHHDRAPAAALSLGRLLAGHGDVDGARNAYQRAIDSGHADAAPAAALGLGMLLADQNDVDGALAAYRQAAAFGHSQFPGLRPTALAGLATLLAGRGEAAEAKAAYQQVIDSGDAGLLPAAAFSLGQLLAQHGDAAGAATAFQRAIDSGSPEFGPKAKVALGVLLLDDADVERSRAALQQAIDAGQAGQGPRDMVNRGLLLARQGDVAGARAAYQRAIDSGDPDWAPAGAVGQGDLLGERGDVAEAVAAYQRAADSGHRDLAPMALMSMAALLAASGDLRGARAAYQQAADSGQAGAMLCIAAVLAAEGDSGGAQTLLRQAADAGIPAAAEYTTALDDDPAGQERASVRLGELAEAGDSDAMNFLGVIAWRAGARDQARAQWLRSRDANDTAAPLLLQICGPGGPGGPG
jgi:predicted negative regulator of RcsB-dependent stress response